MTLTFLFYIPLFLLRDLFRLKSRFWVAFYLALKRLPRALRGRSIEQSDVLYSDREILARINANSAHLR